MDVTTDLPTPARALAIAAHPDDVEFGAGATLAKWAASGCAISHLVCTDGSKGSWNPAQDVTELVATRQDEQRAASRALGGTGDVVFLRWVDGELESGLRQRWEVAYWIRKCRPDVVLGHDPWRRYRLHPDHRAAGWLACDGVVAAREPHVRMSDLPAWRPSALLLWEADEPDLLVDVSASVDAKLAALLAHTSQLRSTMAVEDPTDVDAVNRFRRRVLDRLAEWGRQAGVAHAEAFKLIDAL